MIMSDLKSLNFVLILVIFPQNSSTITYVEKVDRSWGQNSYQSGRSTELSLLGFVVKKVGICLLEDLFDDWLDREEGWLAFEFLGVFG